MEPSLKPQELDEKILCKVTGLKRGESGSETAGLLSNASLNISCYLVPVTLLDAARHVESMAGEGWREAREKQTDCSWAPYCFPYPDSADYAAITHDLGGEEAKETRMKACCQAELTWDIWEEYDPLRPMFLDRKSVV